MKYQNSIAIAIFTLLSLCSYLLYESLLNVNLRHGNVRAASFSFLSIFAYIIMTIEAERWRRTGEYILANKVVKITLLPLCCILYPAFLDEFVPRETHADIFLTAKGIALLIVCWLIMCDFGRFLIDFLIKQNLLDDSRTKILYANFPPQKLSDMNFSLGIIVVLFLATILF